MLTESFIASVQGSVQSASTSSNLKDAGIFLHDYQPLASLKSTFKKSSTRPNCLAVNATHAFAAQADKAVIHVYNRERGNQEALVPFQEKISSLALIGGYHDAGILAMGTDGGRLLLWELCTGRLVSTPASHIQAVTCLAVDPTFRHLLSGSSDSNAQIWDVPALLSFSSGTAQYGQASRQSSLRTLSRHRAAVTCVGFGHSHGAYNIAVTGSADKTLIVWDYEAGELLHIFLLAETPLCAAIDPADRAVYTGFDDGSIQMIDLYHGASASQSIRSTTTEEVPIEPRPTDRWLILQEPDTTDKPASKSTLCLSLSYDATVLLSGHQNGEVRTWHVAKGSSNSTLVDLQSPVTNIHMLPPSGFPNQKKHPLKTLNVVKPRYDSSMSGIGNGQSGTVPLNYILAAQFSSTVSRRRRNPSITKPFEHIISQPGFPPDYLAQSLSSALSSTNTLHHKNSSSSALVPNSIHTTTERSDLLETRDNELSILKAQLSQARTVQDVYAEKATELANEIKKMRDWDREKRRRKKERAERVERERETWRKGVMSGAIVLGEGDRNGIPGGGSVKGKRALNGKSKLESVVNGTTKGRGIKEGRKDVGEKLDIDDEDNNDNSSKAADPAEDEDELSSDTGDLDSD
ncbi:Pre-rRNA-processing protein ipi3 [Agyrium rufum]|nr:Pre-rRNA-processing protein ipi3 [Agyrium rufum]